jgi:large conductance mechanosensitive channel
LPADSGGVSREVESMGRLKEYLSRSNIVDVALAIVLAFAIVKVVDSVVVDIMMPLISRFAGHGADMSNYFIPLAPGIHSDMTYDEAKKIGAVIGYGQFIIALVYFIIAATFIGLIVKGLADLRKDSDSGKDAK